MVRTREKRVVKSVYKEIESADDDVNKSESAQDSDVQSDRVSDEDYEGESTKKRRRGKRRKDKKTSSVSPSLTGNGDLYESVKRRTRGRVKINYKEAKGEEDDDLPVLEKEGGDDNDVVGVRPKRSVRNRKITVQEEENDDNHQEDVKNDDNNQEEVKNADNNQEGVENDDNNHEDVKDLSEGGSIKLLEDEDDDDNVKSVRIKGRKTNDGDSEGEVTNKRQRGRTRRKDKETRTESPSSTGNGDLYESVKRRTRGTVKINYKEAKGEEDDDLSVLGKEGDDDNGVVRVRSKRSVRNRKITVQEEEENDDNNQEVVQNEDNNQEEVKNADSNQEDDVKDLSEGGSIKLLQDEDDDDNVKPVRIKVRKKKELFSDEEKEDKKKKNKYNEDEDYAVENEAESDVSSESDEQKALSSTTSSDEDEPFVPSRSRRKAAKKSKSGKSAPTRNQTQRKKTKKSGSSEGEQSNDFDSDSSLKKKFTFADKKIWHFITWRWPERNQENSSTSKGGIRVREYLVQYPGRSYWEVEWVPETTLDEEHRPLLLGYQRRTNMRTPPHLEEEEAEANPNHQKKRHGNDELYEKYFKYGIEPEWLEIDRVLIHETEGKKKLYLIKWKEVPYEKSTYVYEDDNTVIGLQEAIDKYFTLRDLFLKNRSKKAAKSKQTESTTKLKKAYTERPEFLPEELELHEYQLEGLNWLRYSWATDTNTILADEMGLGKTIQTITFLYSLYKEGYCDGPFLISAPLSTVINWERELKLWAPDFYVVTYVGLQDTRPVIRKYELSFSDQGNVGPRLKKVVGPPRFHVLLTSYEFVSRDMCVLNSFNWAVLVVDEAHRLKSNSSLFFRSLSQYDIKYTLLLTGTPLQNNLTELFNLLNFLCPDKFDDCEDFLEQFSDISKEDQISKLHDLLGSHMLRRLKADVLKCMPGKAEFLVRVELSAMQKKYYKWILTKNFEALNAKTGGHQTTLRNIIMDLKKCCNHPYLFSTASETAPLTKNGLYELEALTKACGKLVLLEKMLKVLKETGHRVLIFSQMTKQLDLLEDFLDGLQYSYERIDGKLRGIDRQAAIDRFNAPESTIFAFLLSTKAGGLGINLATADTVIIYDSDWNPHNDIQAFSRAHRIGQQNKVLIYRFITRNSIEERITQVAKKKMLLTHLVVKKTNEMNFTKQELDDILKFGMEELFKEDENTDLAIHYTEEAVKALLDRTKEEDADATTNVAQGSGINEYLTSFKVATYETTAKEEEAETELAKKSIQADPIPSKTNSNFWSNLLAKDHQEELQKTEMENLKKIYEMGKGKRKPKKVLQKGRKRKVEVIDDVNDEDFAVQEVEESEDSEEEEYDSDDSEIRKTRNSRHNKQEVQKPLMHYNADYQHTLEILGFSSFERKTFLDQIMKFGMPPLATADMLNSQWTPHPLKTKSEAELKAYTSLFMNNLLTNRFRNSLTYIDGVPREGLNAKVVLVRMGVIALIKRKVLEYEVFNGRESVRGYMESACSTKDATVDNPEPKEKGNDGKADEESRSGDEAGTSAYSAYPVINLSDDEDEVVLPTVTDESEVIVISDSDSDVDKPLASRMKSINDGSDKQEKAEKNESSPTSPLEKCEDSGTGKDQPGNGDGGIAEAESSPISSSPSEKEEAGKSSKDQPASNGDGEIADSESSPMSSLPLEKEEGTRPSKDISDSGDGEKAESSPTSPSGKEEDGRPSEDQPDTEDRESMQDKEMSGTETNEENKVSENKDLSRTNSNNENAENPNCSSPEEIDKEIEETKEPKEDVKSVEPIDKEQKDEKSDTEEEVGDTSFEFDIADGGFTELHTVWLYESQAVKSNRSMWHRKHDFWLLVGCIVHGYCQFDLILSDPRLHIVNTPFEDSSGSFSDVELNEIKKRFFNRRIKILEKALLVEEQLIRLSREYNKTIEVPEYVEIEVLDEETGDVVTQKLVKPPTECVFKVLSSLKVLLDDVHSDSSREPLTEENYSSLKKNQIKLQDVPSEDENKSHLPEGCSNELIKKVQLSNFKSKFIVPS